MTTDDPATSRLLPRLAAAIDDLLRGKSSGASLTPEPFSRQLPRLVVTIVLFGAFYGAVMGSYGVRQHGHAIQMLYGAIKVPMLLTISFFLSLPSFMVLNTAQRRAMRE